MLTPVSSGGGVCRLSSSVVGRRREVLAMWTEGQTVQARNAEEKRDKEPRKSLKRSLSS